MRHKRQTTEQTRAALEDIIKAVAHGLDVSLTYIYAILAGQQSDPYAYFKPLFAVVCRVSLVRAKIWLDDLSAIYTAEAHRQMPVSSALVFHGHPTECRKECREAVDSSIDGLPVAEQIKEHYECVEAHTARIAVLTDPDGAVEDAITFSRPMPIGKRAG